MAAPKPSPVLHVISIATACKETKLPAIQSQQNRAGIYIYINVKARLNSCNVYLNYIIRLITICNHQHFDEHYHQLTAAQLMSCSRAAWVLSASSPEAQLEKTGKKLSVDSRLINSYCQTLTCIINLAFINAWALRQSVKLSRRRLSHNSI